MEQHGYRDEKGSYYLDLPVAADYKGRPVSKLKRQRAVSTVFDEEMAEQLLTEKGLLERAHREVITWEWDQDEIYAMYQEDLLTEDELRSLFRVVETFSFVPATG